MASFKMCSFSAVAPLALLTAALGACDGSDRAGRLASVAVAAQAPGTPPKGSPPRGVATIAEVSLRELAVNTPMPGYPAASLRRRSAGVVVTKVIVDGEGRVEKSDVIQSPDPDIAAAVVAALTQWRFKPMRASEAEPGRRFQGKLTLYFRVSDGRPQVLNPAEMAARQGAPRPSPGEDAQVQEIDEAEMRKLSTTQRLVVVDTRERPQYSTGHRDGAINIPFDELTARAQGELSRRDYIVIDCGRDMPELCRHAGGKLLELGFLRVALLLQ